MRISLTAALLGLATQVHALSLTTVGTTDLGVAGQLGATDLHGYRVDIQVVDPFLDYSPGDLLTALCFQPLFGTPASGSTSGGWTLMPLENHPLVSAGEADLVERAADGADVEDFAANMAAENLSLSVLLHEIRYDTVPDLTTGLYQSADVGAAGMMAGAAVVANVDAYLLHHAKFQDLVILDVPQVGEPDPFPLALLGLGMLGLAGRAGRSKGGPK